MEYYPQFSIIIPCYNDLDGLRSCLTGIFRQDTKHSFEIIVIDDCSDFDIAAEISEDYPVVNFYRLGRNSGPGAARNRGISLAKGRYLVFIDSDASPNSLWLDCLSAAFAKGDDIITGPVCHVFGYWARLTALTAFGEYQSKHDGYRKHCPSVNYAVKAEVMASFSYDETIPFAGEDVILSTMFTKAGFRIHYLAAAWVLHNPSLSVRQYFRRTFAYGLGFRASRGRCPELSGYFLHKFLRAASTFVLFFVRVTLDCFRLVKLRQELSIGWWEFPAFIGGIICTRVSYAAGVFMGYLRRDRF